MRIGIDGAGRLVLPKPLRDELGIKGVTELEVAVRDGVIELAVTDMPVRVEERDGEPVLASDEPMPPLSAEDVRAAIDGVRR